MKTLPKLFYVKYSNRNVFIVQRISWERVDYTHDLSSFPAKIILWEMGNNQTAIEYELYILLEIK